MSIDQKKKDGRQKKEFLGYFAFALKNSGFVFVNFLEHVFYEHPSLSFAFSIDSLLIKKELSEKYENISKMNILSLIAVFDGLTGRVVSSKEQIFDIKLFKDFIKLIIQKRVFTMIGPEYILVDKTLGKTAIEHL